MPRTPPPLLLPARMILPVVTLCLALGSTRCAGLSSGTASTIEALDAAACAGLSEVPTIGPFVALACPGEEALLAAALTAAQHDAGALGQSAVLATSSRVAVTRPLGMGRHLVGYVPRALALACQTALNGSP
jgi:hypothetical protein